MTALASQIPPSALDDNLPCLRCGYNLRTLATDGRCPECSAPIASSLDANLLRYADPTWTTILAFSIGVTLAGASFNLLYLFLVAFLDNFPDALWSALGFTLTITLGRQLYWLGIFFLASADPHGPMPKRIRSLR